MKEKQRKLRRLAKGLLGPDWYGPKRQPSKLQVLGRRIIVGGALWIICLPLLGLLDNVWLDRIVGVGGWMLLLGFSLLYFYRFAFRKEGPEINVASKSAKPEIKD